MAEASNPLAKLASRFLGEGQATQRTKRPTLLALDLAAVPFRQDEGLAATGSGPQGHAGCDHAKRIKLFSSQPRGRDLDMVMMQTPDQPPQGFPCRSASRCRFPLTTTAADLNAELKISSSSRRLPAMRTWRIRQIVRKSQ